ncbi:ArsR family transcriptional regulator [Haloferula chungangensis]|uniref:ArsR family transcriptional regulator n=1 Tax=Haloferula chungangensis TaxID=1048331 RepID=A0ABW2LA47_9BACT
MVSTALQDLFGGKAAEAVLLALFHHGEAYGRSIARDFAVSLDSVQRQLDRFERSGTLVCKRQGRTLVYTWNSKSRLASRLRDLTGVVYDGLDPQTKEQLFAERRQPRAKDKPVIRR